MKLIGPEPRAADLRRAATRLRREIDYSLGVYPGGPPATLHTVEDVRVALNDVAETMAVLRHIITALDEHLPAEDSVRKRLQHSLRYYSSYHEVPR